MPDQPYTSADFHNAAHKQIINAAYETLAGTKLDWELVAPFLNAAREVCRSEFQEGARIRFHHVRAEGEQWVEAEEAFLGIAVADRDEGEDWLAETYWVSDVILADRDPEQVRHAVAALERSLAKARDWLDQQENPSPEAGEGSK